MGVWWVKRGILLLLVTILFQGISEALRISTDEVLRQDHIFRLHFLSSRSRGAYKDRLIFLISDFTFWVRRLFLWSHHLFFKIMVHSLRSSDFYFRWWLFYFSDELKYQNKGTLFLLTLSKDQGNLTRSSSLLSAINKKPRKPQKSNSNSNSKR